MKRIIFGLVLSGVSVALAGIDLTPRVYEGSLRFAPIGNSAFAFLHRWNADDIQLVFRQELRNNDAPDTVTMEEYCEARHDLIIPTVGNPTRSPISFGGEDSAVILRNYGFRDGNKIRIVGKPSLCGNRLAIFIEDPQTIERRLKE